MCFEHTDAACPCRAALERVEAVSSLAGLLEDRGPGVRRNAAWALGKIGGPSAVDALLAALTTVTPRCGARRRGRLET
jgi:HEAT repeat protein